MRRELLRKCRNGIGFCDGWLGMRGIGEVWEAVCVWVNEDRMEGVLGWKGRVEPWFFSLMLHCIVMLSHDDRRLRETKYFYVERVV